jgi:hypothetical protein
MQDCRYELRRIPLPKLFGNSEWAPNRGSESGQEGSKESQFGRFLLPERRAETPSAIFQTVSPRTPVNKKRSIGFISRAYLAQRSCPSQDRLSSLLERSPDRPMAVITAPNIKAAAVPKMTPIKAPRAISPLHHSTPTLTSTDTTKNTTVDNITVPASLARILHPIVCVRLCEEPDPLRCREVTQKTALQRCRSSTLTTLGRRPRAVCSPAPRANSSR